MDFNSETRFSRNFISWRGRFSSYSLIGNAQHCSSECVSAIWQFGKLCGVAYKSIAYLGAYHMFNGSVWSDFSRYQNFFYMTVFCILLRIQNWNQLGNPYLILLYFPRMYNCVYPTNIAWWAHKGHTVLFSPKSEHSLDYQGHFMVRK